MTNELTVTNLRCEYKINPLGIDVLQSRLSWLAVSLIQNPKAKKQTAYQVIVSSSKEKLEDDIGDLWDSGKVISDQSCQIVYAGKELTSKEVCFWKVRIWDEDGSITSWSESSFWSMGLLNRADWKAKWISFPVPTEERQAEYSYTTLADKWIWHKQEDNGKYKFGNVYFRKKFDIKNPEEIESSKILITADERFVLYINGKHIDKSDDRIFSWTRPKLIDIKLFLKDGANLIAVEGINTYLDTPGMTAKLFICYKDGKKEIIKTGTDWKSSIKKITDWQTINFDDSEWQISNITAIMGDKPWRVPRLDLFLPPPRYFRKEFTVKKKIKNLFLYASALGLFKIFVNGKTITEDRLTPGWTDYNKRVYYFTYEVQEFLIADNNCIGIIAADGWYSGYIGWEKHREYYGTDPQVILQLDIEYEDGTTEIIITDETWKASFGAIREADILMGETYDARIEKEIYGWNEINFNHEKWNKVKCEENINAELNSYPGIPIRKTIEVKTINITTPQNGKHIFDLGQNIAGCVKLKIDGRKSDKIILRFGEMLDADGKLYTENIRMARATDTYYSKGEAEETWEPSFTYHGFRYIEVTGLNEEPSHGMITGIVFHSDLPVAGSFKCSNEKLNKLYESILWSQRGNYMDLPTDCPQRDERLGWTADAIDFFNTAAYNMDVSAFYTKWLRDLNDAQQNDGSYTAIAPQPDLGVGPLHAGSAGWADTGIVTPYAIYRFYGDKRILEVYFNNMLKYMGYLGIKSDGCIMPDYGYGDWLSVNADTPKDLIATAYYAYDAKLMMEISQILGKNTQAEEFEILFEKIKSAFRQKYINSEGEILSGTQTACVLALYFDLLNKEQEIKTLELLVTDIKNRDWHISTGFVGLTYLVPVLAKFQRQDVIYKLLLNESFPSWLNMLANGATTMWERWDSWDPGKGFYDPLMNSFNHTSLGVIGEWFYSGIGGIIPAAPGFKKIIIKPIIGGGLTYAKVSYNSIYGKIGCGWEITEDKISFEITIPFNTTAEIIIPKVINGKKITGKKGFKDISPGLSPIPSLLTGQAGEKEGAKTKILSFGESSKDALKALSLGEGLGEATLIGGFYHYNVEAGTHRIDVYFT